MVIKNIPKGINDRISKLSSNEAVFETAKPIYQEALSDAGYRYDLKFDPEVGKEPGKSRNRTRARQSVWFNPPFSLNVETNVGKEFLKLVDNFPKNNILAPCFSRNKIKVSYRTMKNMSSVISNHNFKVLNSNSNDTECEPRCNCKVSKKTDCPLPGQCDTD